MSTALQTRELQLLEAVALPKEYENYLECLPKKTLRRIQSSVSGMRHGMHSVAPLMCFGPEKCLFKDFCPVIPRDEYGNFIKKANSIEYGPAEDYPMGRACVMEALDLSQRVLDYMQYLEVSPENPIEMSIIQELAIIDLMKQRALRILSRGDRDGDGVDFLKRDITGYDDYGNASTKTSLHPVVSLIDTWERRREKWLDKLLATRKSKTEMAVKLGNKKDDSRMLQELAQLRSLLTDDLQNKQIIVEGEEILIDD